MTETKWTPGPWEVHENTLSGVPGNGNNFKIGVEGSSYYDYSGIIAELPLWHSLIDEGETEEYLEAKANAHLIAAAPEVVEALRECRNMIHVHTSPDDSIANAVLRQADEALAKAKGEKP